MEIGEQVLNSPEPRTPEDEETMRQHTLLGARMLEELDAYRDEDFVRVAYQICRWHHERYDGSGYPDQLAGTAIPLGARIIAVADSIDAMMSNRSYRPAMTATVCHHEIEKNSGVMYDPQVVAAAMTSKNASRPAVRTAAR